MARESWDVIVVGAGAAGLTAAIYAVRYGLRTLVLEERVAGGVLNEATLVENYPGFPEPIRGADLASRIAEQARRLGAVIREVEPVKTVRLEGDKKVVVTEAGEYECLALIIATGGKKRKLNVPGERELEGRGVSYCAVCDGFFFKGKTVAVVGGGDTAVSEAVFLCDIASKVYLVHRRDKLRAEAAWQKALFSKPNAEVIWNAVVEAILGENRVTGLALRNVATGERSELAVDGVFIAIGEDPNSELAKRLGVRLDDRGYVLVDPKTMATNVPGVFAAGDVTGVLKQLTVAVGQGALAATSAREYIDGLRPK